jgi:hypothetical protein
MVQSLTESTDYLLQEQVQLSLAQCLETNGDITQTLC